MPSLQFHTGLLVLAMSAMHVAAAVVAEENHARAEAALTRGAERLLALQNDDGSWGKPPMIGITALCVIALHDAPGIDAGKRDAAIDAGIEFLLADLDEDGTAEKFFGLRSQSAFWEKTPRYATYSIAVTLLAMATVDKPEHIPLIKRGRAYLRTLQRVNPNSKHHGGFGYGAGGRSANLSITAWSAEAMHHTAYVEGDEQGADPTVTAQNEAMWASIEEFLEATQKNQAVGQDAAEDSDAGGLGYKPSKDASKVVVSGAMSYSGYKTMLYAKLPPDDVRVRAVRKYIAANYDLSEDPGRGKAGYYYYLHAMARALDAAGLDSLKLTDGRLVKWREEIIAVLVGLQGENGGWHNAYGKYMESIPELVTAYAMMTLKTTLGTP
jgi:squalene-hopene/tetraprenyl-beta-curcumene cyclase